MLDEPALARLGYDADDLRRLRAKSDRGLAMVADIRRVLDRFGYLSEWRDDYRIRSVRASLRSDRITCIDAAVLAYGLLEWFPEVKRRVLAIHRRDAAGEECGHCVALYWGPDGRVGAFSKSSYAGLGHRDPVFADEMALAASYARGYLAMGITPLYFGVTTLEEAAGADIDWRFSLDDINALSGRIQERYAYEFARESERALDPLEHVGSQGRTRAAAPAGPSPLTLHDLPELLARMAGGSSDELARNALTFYRGRTLVGRLTRGELVGHVDRIAFHLFETLGMRRGDPVALLSQNALEIPVIVLALLRIGATIVPLNPGTPAEDWAYILGHCGARGLIASSDLLEPGRSAGPRLGFAVTIEALWRDAVAGPVPEANARLTDELAIVLYTSGTTGNPKGVALTHANILANAWSMALNFGLDATTQFAVLPLYHAHAFGFGLMTSLLSGGHLVFADRFDPFTWMDVIKKESVEITSVVPTLLSQLLQLHVHHEKVPSLRGVMVSSAPLEPALAWAFEEQTGLPLIQGWGLSEYTNFACCLPPDDDPARHRHLLFGREYPCVGPALAPTEVTVRDSTGAEVAELALGELWVRGPSRMRGYFKDEEATRNAMSEDWLRTGDEGFFAVEGGQRVFFITGRIKEIICRGAEKYSPLAIERRITAALPEVGGSLVVLGFPHRVHGEEIGAYLETGELTDDLAGRLKQTIEAMLPDQRPKVLLFGAAPIPRTHTGKIQRRKLTSLFARYDECRGALQIAGAAHPGTSSTTL
ncbi:MAG TPA: class I adenylate-forming enzyme family protein [Polyangiaceae bacterium]|nr:class I adenylate-forming enzyme family protein [Polyangiaceae bacterium]